MQDSFKKKRLLTKRILPLTLVLVLIVSIVAVAFGTFGAGVGMWLTNHAEDAWAITGMEHGDYKEGHL